MEKKLREIKQYIKEQGDKPTGLPNGAIAVADMLAWLEHHKPAKWNRDDEQYLQVTKNALAKYQVSDQWDANIISRWLENKVKSNILQPQQEWSDDDERLRKSCIAHIEDELERIRNDKYGHSEIISDLKESCRERINWLESLRSRNHWKPSDDQLIALQEAMNVVGLLTLTGSKLNCLYQEIKKL